MRSRLRSLLRRAGIDVVRYPVHTTVAGHLRQVLDTVGSTVVLDIGANHGQFGRSLRQDCRYKGRIASFEPIEESRRILERLASDDPAWSVHPVAVGDVDDVSTMQTFAGSDWNSLHAPHFENLTMVGRSIAATGTVDVAVRRLDGLWHDVVHTATGVFLKSDTQGHDLKVLEGAGSFLDDIAGLMLEASIVPFYDGEPTLNETIDKVADLGFAPSGFFPVAREKNSLALTTLDVCFVKVDRSQRRAPDS